MKRNLLAHNFSKNGRRFLRFSPPGFKTVQIGTAKTTTRFEKRNWKNSRYSRVAFANQPTKRYTFFDASYVLCRLYSLFAAICRTSGLSQNQRLHQEGTQNGAKEPQRPFYHQRTNKPILNRTQSDSIREMSFVK